MGNVSRAAVYARISSDQDGTALGVTRQLEDCRGLADRLGWVVAEEYVDNDISAYSGKRRPAYERMLADLADGFRDGVIVYHPDRLTRRPVELEQFVEVLTAAGVAQVQYVTGSPLNIGDGDGLMVARLMSVVAAHESASKSRRIRRKMDEVAASGMPHGGSNRPFGYDDDKITVRPVEAEVVKVLVARFLAGESLRSLAMWLEAEGVRTVAGGPWRTPTLRALLMSGRIAGLREHRGEVVGPAVWEPIISETDRDRVLARMAEKAVTGRREPRRYLLSGLLRCGRCGIRLYSQARKDTRRYVCLSGPDHAGCGRLSVVAAPVEELVADAVLYRLDTAELAAALAGRADQDEATAALSQSLSDDRVRLDDLAGVYAARGISLREWMAARRPIEERITDTERRLSRLTRTDALAGLVGNGQQLRDAWAGLNLTRQNAIVRALLDHADIGPGIRGAHALDPARVMPVWRL